MTCRYSAYSEVGGRERGTKGQSGRDQSADGPEQTDLRGLLRTDPERATGQTDSQQPSAGPKREHPGLCAAKTSGKF